ncbi:sirohydrochlorin chelatase [Thauera sp. WH-2]|uniref:sirohydrochlorin chelatase n=1 Tax=unclassified Thauera TaxID=2609274 RepID=UPI002A4DCDB4|nr:CbiX/SirB N-terminal domain-containing protein [Thauera sp.]
MTAAPRSQSAIVLFGHGARDPEWAGPMRRIRDTVLARPDAPRTELAFLEFMTPTLPEAIAALAADGVRQIAVVPMFLAQGGHLKRDLPILLDEARAAHPECEISLATAAGEAEPVVVAMADYAASCLN